MDKDFNLTIEEARNLVLVDKNNMVHTFYNVPFGLIGGDHSEESIIQDIQNAKRLNLAGESAQAMGHALAIIGKDATKHDEILFVETKKCEVEKLLKKHKEIFK